MKHSESASRNKRLTRSGIYLPVSEKLHLKTASTLQTRPSFFERLENRVKVNLPKLLQVNSFKHGKSYPLTELVVGHLAKWFGRVKQ